MKRDRRLRDRDRDRDEDTSRPPASYAPKGVRGWVRFLLKNGTTIWLVASIVFVFAAVRTAKLYKNLNSDLEQLLPRNAESVRAIDELRARVSGLQYLGVVVDTGSAENVPAAERLLDDLAARVRTYPKALVASVRTGDAEERAFLEKHAALYIDKDDLASILDRITARRDWEVSREVGSSLDDEAPAPPLDFGDIERKYADQANENSRTVRHRFSNPDLHTSLMLIEAGSFSTAQGAGAELLKRVKADLASLGGPDAYAKGMRVGYAGDIAISVEETSALVSDLALSSAIVLVLVVGSLLYYFRWWRCLVVILPPLAVTTVTAFGIASLPPFSVTELNSNTAFLGAIIVGNGINVGIMLLARYVEERRNGHGVETSLELAVYGVRRGTFAAALAASASYTSLVLTQFRGFRQFGIIGGLGMVLAWCVTFVLLPPLVRWVDHDGRSAPKPLPSDGMTGRLARLIKAWPGAIVFGAFVLTAASAFEIAHIDDSELEQDFSKLRRRDTWKDGEGYWGRRMDELLGVYLTPIAILTDDAAQARRVADAVRREMKAGELDGFVSSVRTEDDVWPPDQQEKIALLERIREVVTPKIRASIPEEKKTTILRILDQKDDAPITVAELPRTFTTGLREQDGHLDRIVLVFPRASRGLWEGKPLATFIGRLRDIARDSAGPGGRPARVAGALALSTDILESIRRDGPRASMGALAGVVLVVFALFRFSSSTPKVIASLLIGVAWLLALAMVFRIKINFANFIAFPITFGIGVEYAVNVMTRYVQDGSRDVGPAVHAAGGAVALCSLTTIIGYSSLLMAENRALFLFGCLAVLGEITCLVAAVVALPAWLEWRRRSGTSPIVATSEHG